MPVQVLIIDSNVGFIVRLKKALEEYDYEVRAVGRPKAALTALRHGRFDVAVIDVDLESVGELIQSIREHQPDLPVILAGYREGDPKKIAAVGEQAYISKPYLARDLIPIIEQVIAGTEQQPAQERWHMDALAEMALFQAVESEPPPDDEATIGEVFSSLSDPEIEAEIVRKADLGSDDHQLPLPPDTLPESMVGEQPPLRQSPIIDEPPASVEDSPAVSALRASSDNAIVDSILLKSQADDQEAIRPLPSWEESSTSEDDLARIEALLRTAPAPAPPESEPPPYTAVTQPVGLPEVDLLPDPEDTGHTPPRVSDDLNPELLEALADAEDLDDPRLQAALQELTPPEEEELVATSVDEITKAMGVITLDEESEVMEEEDSPDAEAVDELLGEIDIVAHAALQLTQFSLESTALGTLLTHNDFLVARTGTFEDTTWNSIAEEVAAAWQREGNPRTRLLYRNLSELGQTMIFSTRTIDELMLTMIFGADTPLRIIRRQAARLSEAMALVPEPTITPAEAPDAPTETPAQVAQDVEIPPAAQTSPSRPTDLHPPEDLPARVQPQAPAEEKPQTPPRKPGEYVGYACLWLMQKPDLVDEALAGAVERWLGRAADQNDWDIVDLRIGERWVNLHIEIPVKTMPGQVIQTLMRKTETWMVEALGNDQEHLPSMWADGYSVTTPGRLLEMPEIERFLSYHDGQAR